MSNLRDQYQLQAKLTSYKKKNWFRGQVPIDQPEIDMYGCLDQETLEMAW